MSSFFNSGKFCFIQGINGNSQIFVNGKRIETKSDLTPSVKYYNCYIQVYDENDKLLETIDEESQVKINIQCESVGEITNNIGTLNIESKTCGNLESTSGAVTITGNCEKVNSVSGSIAIIGNVSGSCSTISGSIQSDIINGDCSSISGSIQNSKRTKY